jgi:hypothetical protein
MGVMGESFGQGGWRGEGDISVRLINIVFCVHICEVASNT